MAIFQLNKPQNQFQHMNNKQSFLFIRIINVKRFNKVISSKELFSYMHVVKRKGYEFYGFSAYSLE